MFFFAFLIAAAIPAVQNNFKKEESLFDKIAGKAKYYANKILDPDSLGETINVHLQEGEEVKLEQGFQTKNQPTSNEKDQNL